MMAGPAIVKMNALTELIENVAFKFGVCSINFRDDESKPFLNS